VVCLGILVALGAFGLARLAGSSCTPLSRTPCVRVLFLGNSHTYVNDLPTVFRELARSDGRNVETGVVANGGETLAEHAAAPESIAAIRGTSWAFVVLQEQSEIPAFEALRQSQMYPAGRSLAGMIRAAGATPILLETWAHRDGLPDQRISNPEMQAAISEGYRVLGAELGVAVAPAGDVWQVAQRRDPRLALWQADGNHPTLAGTYLAACVLYGRIFNASPAGIADTAGLPPDVAGLLQVVAYQR
jgi:hypothetical protein